MAEQTYEQLMAAFLDLQNRMLAIQQQQAEALKVQTDRTAPKENPNYQPNSIFIDPVSGREYRELLKCEMFFGPIRLNRTPITKDELDALNRIQPVEKAPVIKTDGATGRVTVRAREDAEGRVQRLDIDLDLKKDQQPQHWPSLWEFAMQVAAAAPKATVAA